jgi:hypothetical protein
MPIQKRYFRSISRDPEFLLDAKAKTWIPTENLRDFSALFENIGESIESGYHDFVKQSRFDWILRLDSDEILTKSGFRFLEENAFEPDTVVGFLRYQVIDINGKFRVLDLPEFEPQNHIQYRFFSRTFGSFGSQYIHNPGFDLSERKLVLAPSDCAIYHLDFVLRNHARRVEKMERYLSLGQPPVMNIMQLGPERVKFSNKIIDKEILKFLKRNKGLINGIQNAL